MNGGDNCFRRSQRRIDRHAGGDGALGFGWMIEQFFRELHCPPDIGGASIKFAVNEIGAATKEQTDWRGDDDIIAKIQPGNLVTARVIQTEEQNAHHAAVARHTAFPDAEDRHRLAQHFRFVEKNVTEHR